MPPPGGSRRDPLSVRSSSLKPWEGDHERLATIHFKILRGHSDIVTSCLFCFDDTKIISGSYDSTVKLWDIDHCIPIQTFKDEHTGPISECCLSPDYKRKRRKQFTRSQLKRACRTPCTLILRKTKSHMTYKETQENLTNHSQLKTLQ